MSNDDQVPEFLPQDHLTRAVYSRARQHLHPAILAHSFRVFAHAISRSKKESIAWSENPRNLVLLATACLFHDIGTADKYNTGSTRFELESADAAQDFLTARGVPAEDVKEVWLAIALHTTPQVPERTSHLARLVRLAVLTDFGGRNATGLVTKEGVDRDFPRGDIEKVLGDAVVAQAMKQPGKAPKHCWPGDLYRAKLVDPEYQGINKAF